MAADKDDYFQKVGRSTATTLSAPGYTIGNTTINVASTANWGDSTGVTFAIDEVDSDGARIAGTYNVFRGVVSSATQVSDLEYVGGDANRDYSAGATTRVYVTVSSYRDNRLIDGILVHADQDGTLKAGAVDNATVLANDVVETAKIADSAVTADKIAIGTIVKTDSTTNRTIGSTLGSLSETIQITAGTWEIWYNVCVDHSSGSNVSQGAYVALSTSTSSYSHPGLRSLFYIGIDTGGGGNKVKGVTLSAREIVTVATTTTFTLIGVRSGTADATLAANQVPTALRARKLSSQTS